MVRVQAEERANRPNTEFQGGGLIMVNVQVSPELIERIKKRYTYFPPDIPANYLVDQCLRMLLLDDKAEEKKK